MTGVKQDSRPPGGTLPPTEVLNSVSGTECADWQVELVLPSLLAVHDGLNKRVSRN